MIHHALYFQDLEGMCERWWKEPRCSLSGPVGSKRNYTTSITQVSITFGFFKHVLVEPLLVILSIIDRIQTLPYSSKILSYLNVLL